MGKQSWADHEWTAGSRDWTWLSPQTVARWLAQIASDTSLRRRSLDQWVQSPTYGRLYNQMRLSGLSERIYAIETCNALIGHTALPSNISAGKVWWSKRRIVTGAMRNLHLTRMEATPRLRETYLPIEAMKRRRMVACWIQLLPQQSPYLILEQSLPIPDDILTFEVAALLGFYQREAAHYLGCPVALPLVLPDMHADVLVTPLVHAFAQGLLGLDTCPMSAVPIEFRCQCSAVTWRLDTPPPSHPVATDELVYSERPDYLGVIDADSAKTQILDRRNLPSHPRNINN